MFCLDKIFQLNTKEKIDESYANNYLKTSSVSTDHTDQSLLIVLDDDDITNDNDDENGNEQYNLSTIKINSQESLSNSDEHNTNIFKNNLPKGIN